MLVSKKVEGEYRKWSREKQSADESEWRRVMENSELESELRHFRRRHNILFENSLAYSQEVIDEHSDELRQIAERYDVNWKRMELRFYMLAFCGRDDETLFFSSLGFEIEYLEDGRIRVTYEPDSDLLHPYFRDILLDREHILATDPPPRPIEDGRRMDWRPVWEWWKRHQQFTQKDIAQHLGYKHGTVRTAMAAVENEMNS
jgi:hypothetical protein